MIDRELFLKEVEELVLTKDIDRKDLEILFNIVDGKKYDGIQAEFLADKIVSDLFKVYSVEPLVPWDFLSTEIGKAIIAAKFEVENEVYFVSDLVEITGYTRQYISKEIKNNNISYSKKGGIIYFDQKQIDNYLRKKGLETIKEKKDLKYKQVKENIVNGEYERECKYGEE